MGLDEECEIRVLSVQPYLGREIAAKREYVLDPSDTSKVLLVNETEYLHLPLHDTTMALRQRSWNKFKACSAHMADYTLKYDVLDAPGEDLRAVMSTKVVARVFSLRTAQQYRCVVYKHNAL